jgi:glycosyltransferase involved in cell wall biosynthesis
MLSIIIPAKNEEKYLPLLLDSIKKQEYKDHETIVADANSTDKTVEVAKSYGCIVVRGGLLPYGRNRGAEAAREDVLLFLDADTILPPHFLKYAMDRFNSKKADIAGFAVLPPDGNWVDKFFYRFLNVFSFLTQKWLPYASCGILAKKELHQKIGGFDEKIVFIEDYPYAKAASKVAKYIYMYKNPIYTSARRFEKEGRFKIYSKYLLAQLHMAFIGPIKSDVFKYKWSHYDEEEDKK